MKNKILITVLAIVILTCGLISMSVSAGSIPFSVEPGKVIGYNIKSGSKFSFAITITNNASAVKTFQISTRLPDILGEGYEASDGKWISLPDSIEVNPNDTETINVEVIAPEKSSETWIGITEDKSGLRYELITKVMLNITKSGVSSLGIVKYSQPGEEKQILSYDKSHDTSYTIPIIIGSIVFVLLLMIVITVILVRRKKKQRIPEVQ